MLPISSARFELLDLLARGRVRRLGGIERRHAVAERRAVDLHEDQAEPAGHVLHERRLAVAGRRDQQQQAHPVGALGVAGRAELLGEVVADERQVNRVDQPLRTKEVSTFGLKSSRPSRARASAIRSFFDC